MEQMLDLITLKKALQIDIEKNDSFIKGLIQSYIKENDKDDLFQFYKLKTYLAKNGISTIEIQQIVLLLEVEGAKQTFLQNNVSNNDIQRFIKKAQQISGLKTETILKIMDYLLQETKLSKGIYRNSDLENLRKQGYVAYSIPYSIYVSEIVKIKVKMEKQQYEEALQLTTSLLETNIAEVKYLHAECLKHCSKQVDNNFILKLEKEAADGGYALAALDVANYYYSIQEYALAYEYYMGYGAPLLSNDQRKKVTNIENIKIYNNRLWHNCLWIEVLIILTLVLSCFGKLYSSYLPLGIMIILWTIFVLYYKRAFLKNVNPYDINYSYILFLVIPWVIYMMTRIIF